MDAFVSAEKTTFIYKPHYAEEKGVIAIEEMNLEIRRGEFLVILGRNGSGKSTFAKLINALLLPTQGKISVNGMDTRDAKHLWEIRRSAGMVFQNPDNQIVGTTVEEDIAFGPENIGVASEEIRKRVDGALHVIGMGQYARHAPHLLSGGQKQKVAVAGILAMEPECIVLDEATSMLDPVGRRELLAVIHKLNKIDGITVIHITHNMDEAVDADRVVVLDKGAVVIEGLPRDVFSRVNEIKALGLDVPSVTELFYELQCSGIKLPEGILTVDEAFGILYGMLCPEVKCQ
jgi:energy-coupling factor transport system ATP-binding protein